VNSKTLIDALVRQTTVLIAHVATSAGLRAPLAHVANQVFLELTTELEKQGLGQKVIADMFGLALRSYQQKLRRLSESETDQGRTLWEAVYAFISEKRVQRRHEVLARFARDHEASVKSILKDLCESGLVYRTGTGDATVYRAAPPEDWVADDTVGEVCVAAWIWVVVHHDGPITLEQVRSRIAAQPATVERALGRLVSEQRVTETPGADGISLYQTKHCLIPLGARRGWEAALLDQFQAVVSAMCVKLRNGETRALPDDEVGGSTYTFDVWPGHPEETEVRALLKQQRDALSRLWSRVTDYNQTVPAPPASGRRVTFYCGQYATTDHDPKEGAPSDAPATPGAA
jgi:predicted transcriptional regulator